MTIKFYKKVKTFKTKNGTILKSYGGIEGPIMQMAKLFPDFDLGAEEKDNSNIVKFERPNK
mgnify:FL=1